MDDIDRFVISKSSMLLSTSKIVDGCFRLQDKIRDFLWQKYDIKSEDIIAIRFFNRNVNYYCTLYAKFMYILPKKRRNDFDRIEWMRNTKDHRLFLRVWYSEVPQSDKWHFHLVMTDKEIDCSDLIWDE